MWSRRTLQHFAVGISILSVIYNGGEGAVSIYFGEESASLSLFFFGVQSLIEVISALLVVWRFYVIAPPGEETSTISTEQINQERIATITIGALFGLLTLGTVITSIFNLVRGMRPDSSNFSLIISGTALVLMILIWAPKPWLAKKLNSSAMSGEAKCSLACIYITTVLLVGSIIYKLWPSVWWFDSATSLVLAVFFGKETVEMIKWGTSAEFSGGCCDTCHSVATEAPMNGVEEGIRDPQVVVLLNINGVVKPCCNDACH